MRVIATAPGYDNIKVREVDEEFDMPDGSKAHWFVPVELAKKAAKAKSEKATKTDSKTEGDKPEGDGDLA